MRTPLRTLLPTLCLAAALPPAAAAQVWSTPAPVREARQEVAAAEVDGRLYVVGGIRGDASIADTVEAWDPQSGWTFVEPHPTPIHHTAAVGLDGLLYVLGGWLDFFATPSAALHAYDPATDQWTELAPMPTARGGLAAAALDGRIYAVGGSPDARERDFAVYDPAADDWTPLPPMPTPRNHHAAAALGGLFYAVGGRTGLLFIDTITDAVESYDPETGLWDDVAPLPTARGGIAAAVLDGRIYVFGGEGSDQPNGVFEEVESYRPGLDRWVRHTPMPTPRHGIGAAALGGRLHVPAGAPIEAFSVTDVHEAFDPAQEPDPDGDGVPTSDDDCADVANPEQLDTDADGFGNACDPDYDGDGVVGIADFNLFRSAFGLREGEPGFDPDFDHGGDGVVGLPDFSVYRLFFGSVPGPSGLPCAGAPPCP